MDFNDPNSPTNPFNPSSPLNPNNPAYLKNPDSKELPKLKSTFEAILILFLSVVFVTAFFEAAVSLTNGQLWNPFK